VRSVSALDQGLPGTIGNQPYSMSAMARKGSEVRFVTREDFEHIMRSKPFLYPKLLQVLTAEVQSALQAISDT
jgi:CRP-like cAMP-binding protein